MTKISLKSKSQPIVGVHLFFSCPEGNRLRLIEHTYHPFNSLSIHMDTAVPQDFESTVLGSRCDELCVQCCKYAYRSHECKLRIIHLASEVKLYYSFGSTLPVWGGKGIQGMVWFSSDDFKFSLFGTLRNGGTAMGS